MYIELYLSILQVQILKGLREYYLNLTLTSFSNYLIFVTLCLHVFKWKQCKIINNITPLKILYNLYSPILLSSRDFIKTFLIVTSNELSWIHVLSFSVLVLKGKLSFESDFAYFLQVSLVTNKHLLVGFSKGDKEGPIVTQRLNIPTW